MATKERDPSLQVTPPPYSMTSPVTFFVPVPVYVPPVQPEQNNNMNQFVPFSFYPQHSVFVPNFNQQAYANFVQFSAPVPDYLYPFNSPSIEMKSFGQATTESPPQMNSQAFDTKPTTKRCSRCEKHYVDEENKPGACRYHTGKYVTKYQSRLATGSFKSWSCCSEITRTSIGCKSGSHIEDLSYTQMLDQINFMVKSTEGMRLSQAPPQYKAQVDSILDQNLENSISSFNDLNQLTKIDPNEAKEEIDFPELSEDTVQVNGKNYLKHLVTSTDTLVGISLKYRVMVDEIKSLNRLVNDDSLFTRHFILVPFKGQNIEKMTLEEKEKAKEQMKQQLILRFSRQVKCSASEAKFYLESNRFNYEKAIKDRTEDVNFEKKNVPPIPISRPFKSSSSLSFGFHPKKANQSTPTPI